LPYYAAADIYVQPTFYDSFGLTALEAAACGLPVITSRSAGVSELVRDGREGYVLPDPADDASLAERLHAMLDPAARRAMGNAARQLAQEHTFARNCEEIVALYREVTQRRPRTA
jgi:glycosyltransferase involved in cell wall biosynthesis